MVMKEFNLDQFSKDLVALRAKRSTSDFAKKLNIEEPILISLENKSYIPSSNILKDICELSGKKPNDYFNDSIDALCYALDSIDNYSDKKKFKEATERINIREKYETLARRN